MTEIEWLRCPDCQGEARYLNGCDEHCYCLACHSFFEEERFDADCTSPSDDGSSRDENL